MTLEEFLAELKDLEWNFLSFYGSAIRTKDNQCPITAVCKKVTGKYFTNYGWDQAAFEISLSNNIASQIVDASDGSISEMRTKLLEAIGFEESNLIP